MYLQFTSCVWNWIFLCWAYSFVDVKWTNVGILGHITYSKSHIFTSIYPSFTFFWEYLFVRKMKKSNSFYMWPVQIPRITITLAMSTVFSSHHFCFNVRIVHKLAPRWRTSWKKFCGLAPWSSASRMVGKRKCCLSGWFQSSADTSFIIFVSKVRLGLVRMLVQSWILFVFLVSFKILMIFQ